MCPTPACPESVCLISGHMSLMELSVAVERWTRGDAFDDLFRTLVDPQMPSGVVKCTMLCG